MKRFLLLFTVCLLSICCLKADSSVRSFNTNFVQRADTVFNADCMDARLHSLKLNVLAEYNMAKLECDTLKINGGMLSGNFSFLMDAFSRKQKSIYEKK